MKLSLFMNVLLISSLSLLAIGCGKDKKKSKDDNSYYGYYNPYVMGQQPSASGAAAITALTNYLNAPEAKQNLFGPVIVQKSRYSCTTKDFLGISFLPVNVCKYSQVSDPVVYVVLGQARKDIKPSLNNLLVPTGGYTLGNVVQYGSIIQIEHYMGQETRQYTVELSRHAVSNPTIIKDTAAQQIDSVVYPQL